MDIDLNIADPQQDFLLDLNQIPPIDLNNQPAENAPNNQPAQNALNNQSDDIPIHNPLPNPHIFLDLNEYPSENFPIDLNCQPSDNVPNTQTLENHYPIHNPLLIPHETIQQPENICIPKKKKNLTSNQKQAIIQMLIHESQDGILPKGAITKVATHFAISTRSVSKIWSASKESIASGSLVDTSSKMVNTGRKRVQIDLETMKTIPFRRRTNIRSLAKALGIGKSTVHRRIKEGSLRPHSNPVRPYLTDENKKSRLKFCLSMINKGMAGTRKSFFTMFDRIHIDEKWFFMSKTSQRYYLHPHETEPFRTCKSKRFVTKIMFLAAVARPRIDATSNNEFNGKIGIWPFVFQEPAKRTSKNRVAGTLETKPIQSVNKDVIRACLINNLLPAIKEKWPSDSINTIFIQQDNARPHIDGKDVEFLEAVRSTGLDIRLCSQPPNSPDLNVLDLGFFRAIDSLQHQEAPGTIEEFISSVKKSFDMFPAIELNNVFLTLQACMVEILKNFGGINYKIPHMNKKKLIRDEELAICLECDTDVMEQAEEFIVGQVFLDNET